jgi:hypothetical protein
MERATGIEPAYTAWKAVVLPLNYARLCASEILTNVPSTRRGVACKVVSE